MTSPRSSSQQVLRIIDANLNRIGEGLRLIEEIARLMLDDTALTGQLKTLRHELIRSDSSFQQRLLESRNAGGDVGADMEVAGEEKEKALPIVLVANARRVQESLRVLEELSKTPEAPAELESEKFKQARFNLYTIEQELMSRLTHREKLKLIPGLYVIMDTQLLKGRSHLEVAEQAIDGGATTLQLRDKIQSKKELLPLARQFKALCSERKVLFIMNDYLDIALDSDADGIHLGQDDLPVEVARRLLPPDKIIGCSTTTPALAITAQADGADYIAVGAMYPTASKISTTTPAKVVGLETLRRVRKAVTAPIVAIGGITRENVREVVAAGADSVAVIGAVLGAESPQEAARQIIESMEVPE